ncbi:FkbM family methyltransferase [Streptomyces sp. NPDC059989]|uniref:FkbM family methyltransferase n=1 Tax=Streptomyces sp. NPDC059989 TaxID=3347026 RepID=UPI0036CADC51
MADTRAGDQLTARAVLRGARRGTGFGYLRRDEDGASMTRTQLVLRQVGELAADLGTGAGLSPLSRLHLARWLFAYHLGMAVRFPLGERVRSFPLRARGGARLRCHLRWHASDLHVLREVFAQQAYALPARAVPAEVRTVVDLGSNIGLSSLYFSMQFPEARVVCVEPVADSVEILRLNAERNGLDWRIEEAAIAAREGTATLYPNGWWASSSTTPAVAKAREALAHRPEHALRLEHRQVRTLPVSVLLDRHGLRSVDVMKIDVEGAEEEIFLNGDVAWLDRVGVLLLDLHAKYVPADAVVGVLREHGFHRFAERGAHSSVFVRAQHRESP